MTDPEQPPALLASDADRERGLTVLRDAVVDGRLTLEEFSDRVEHVQLARTEPELARLMADLPAPASGGPLVAPATPAAGTPVRYRAFMSRLVRSGPWELAAHTSFRCIFGTVVLDLREARLHGDEVLLDVFNLFGTVTVLVPPGVRISVEGGGLFASQVIEPGSGTLLRDAPLLRIRAAGPGGTLRVSSREPRNAFAELMRSMGELPASWFPPYGRDR